MLFRSTRACRPEAPGDPPAPLRHLTCGHLFPSPELGIHPAPAPSGSELPSSPGPLPVPAWNTAQPLAPHSLCSAPGRGGAGLDLWMRRLGPTNWGHRYAGTPARGLPRSRALLVCDSTGQRPPNRPPGWRQQTGGRTELGRVGWTVPKTKANCSAPPHLPSPARQPASHCTGPGRPSDRKSVV